MGYLDKNAPSITRIRTKKRVRVSSSLVARRGKPPKAIAQISFSVRLNASISNGFLVARWWKPANCYHWDKLYRATIYELIRGAKGYWQSPSIDASSFRLTFEITISSLELAFTRKVQTRATEPRIDLRKQGELHRYEPYFSHAFPKANASELRFAPYRYESTLPIQGVSRKRYKTTTTYFKPCRQRRIRIGDFSTKNTRKKYEIRVGNGAR